MKNNYKLGLAAIVASITLIGCGGDSSSATPTEVTGQFVDTYVSGLNYTCDPSEKEGITNDMGQYTCNAGDTVTFSLGAYVLGTATASSGIVTPYDIQSDNETSAINVARLLQSLDTNDSDDKITIPENFTALDNSTIELNATFNDFEAAIEAAVDGLELIGSEAAQNNMDNDILYALVAEKTLYLASYDFVDEMVFNADVSLITWTEVTPGEENPEHGTFETMIDAGTLIIATDGGVKTLTFVKQTDTYIEFDVLEEESVRFYYNQADAEAYYDSLQPIPMTTEMVNGKVFYTEGSDSSDFELISFISSSEVIFREILLNQDGSINVDTGANVYPYTINPSGEVVIGFTDHNTIYALLSTTDTQWNMLKDGDASSPYSTWLLNAPSNIPTSLLIETFVAGKDFTVDGEVILSFGSDYTFSDTDNCSGTWEVTENTLAVTGSCSFNITFNEELVDGMTITLNITDEIPEVTLDTTFTEIK